MAWLLVRPHDEDVVLPGEKILYKERRHWAAVTPELFQFVAVLFLQGAFAMRGTTGMGTVLLFGTVLSVLFALSTMFLQNYLEDQLIGETLQEELDDYVNQLREDPSVVEPFYSRIQGFLTRPGDPNETVNAADYWKTSIGKFKLTIEFDNTLLPDGVDTLPREVEVLLDVGLAGYPGELFLDENDLEVKSNKWEAK